MASNEACWRRCKGISVGLRDSERRRGGQRRIAQESDREVRICQDDPGLPGRYPTSTSENRFQLCRFNSKIHGAGEKVAGLFHIGSWKIAVAGQNANLKAARRDENSIGELLGCGYSELIARCPLAVFASGFIRTISTLSDPRRRRVNSFFSSSCGRPNFFLICNFPPLTPVFRHSNDTML